MNQLIKLLEDTEQLNKIKANYIKDSPIYIWSN